MRSKFLWLVLLVVDFCVAWMDERPVLESIDGNLIISSAKDRNITIKILGKGYFNVHDIDLISVAVSAKSASRLVERWRDGYLQELMEKVHRLLETVEGPYGLGRRISLLENGVDPSANSSTWRPYRPPTDANHQVDEITKVAIRTLTERLRRIETRLRSVVSKLRQNKCASNPCQNGGTCIKIYDGYQCICPSNWEGQSCTHDVNECAIYLGTDLGCQNGATCTNLPGSYQCTCAQGWYGIQCTSATAVCNSEDSHKLCGHHGTCVPTGTALKYTCICEQGWKSQQNDPACTVDVNECEAPHPPCSTQPMVPCVNIPGSFYCGSCPAGYTGNGHYCSDLDECSTDNGGCSTVPKVQCINTMGSRVCGPCPPGYQGDGVTCVFIGTCRINNGGCHPLATCIENPGYTNVLVECQCPSGYHGNGMGPQGCQPGTAVVVNGPCASNPCIHGTCLPHGQEFICRCEPGFTGMTCATAVSPCSPNPCKNNGICTITAARTASCECTAAYTGPRCDKPKETCGGVIRDSSGTLTYPMSGATYGHGLSCAFILATNLSLVLNVTFTKFDLESSPGCRHDFLQIHDGGNAGSHTLGRFCGNNLPLNGNIISTHNSLYLWFHSDNSVAHTGFSLHWNTIPPVCGDFLTSEHGTISSPGSPGRYSPNRDCIWDVNVRPGKRIQFHFFTVLIEPHRACNMDYLEINETIHDRSVQLGLYCNHTHPPALLTSGSHAIVHFHSDSFGQDLGFQITYASVEGSPGCGGVYTAGNGIISNPSEGATYSPNMLCEWQIQLPIGEKIKITWILLGLEDSQSCKFDYINIYEGATVESPLAGRFCGNDLPPPMTLDTNVALIVFKSDWSHEHYGFRIKYETACGGIFSESTGVIKSPYYPNNYSSARTCIYEIIQPPGYGIELRIIDMSIEGSSFIGCYFDHLEIHDGDNENATVLYNLCGDQNNMPSDPIFSTHNYMYIKFHADGNVESRGFLANYTAVERRCGGLLKTSPGTIRNPGESESYINNEHCIWIIQAPPGHVIQLTWTTFDLEYQIKCENDYVKVTEEYNGEDADIGQYCGTKKPPTLTSQGRTMTIIFHTDTAITSDGFSANYLFIDAAKVCGGHYFTPNGVIRSPGYPDYYPTNRECVWVIEAPNKLQIKLHFEKFEIEYHSTCTFDYLEIRSGGYDSSPLIGKFCGSTIPNEIQSLTNQIYIKFVSDGSRGREGFLINWDSTTYGCGGTLTSAIGDIVSPYYPQVYSRSSECTWKIAVSAGSRVEILFIDLDLEGHVRCRFDYIEISEEVNGRRKNTNRYCGTTRPSSLILESNIVTVRFRSDFSNSGRGFRLQYHTLCSNKIHGFNGVIESPNFPNEYPSSINCSWIIDAPRGNKINMTFSHFALESHSDEVCKFDYLALKEGDNDQANTELGKYCGSNSLPSKITSTQHQMFVEFFTDEFYTYGGFRLEWIVDGCGGRLNRPQGKFTSPGYPKPYPTDVECEWLIEVDYGHSVEIIFDEINTEELNTCNYDKIEIYGGEDITAPKLASFCHTAKTIAFTSSTNKMFVKFTSDSSYTGRGFSANYTAVPLSCGGRFQANGGFIHSANYPKNYPNGQNCEWFIQVDKNHAINFTFLDFDIEDTTNCTDDYVKIFDGPTKNDVELGTFCKNTLPPSIISSGNTILVVMRTDNLIAAKGFKAQFERTCGARILTNDTGILSASSDLHSFETGANCSWIIVAADLADHVTLSIFHMDMASIFEWDETCTQHYLRVYEGEGLDGPVRGTWCLNKAPPPIVSNGNALTVHLVADPSSSEYAFQASYSILNSACGGNYHSEQGTLASPMYPESYPTNAECVWILNTAPGNKINLVFSEFNIESSPNCDSDYVEIREESGIGKLIGVYCGDNIDQVTADKKLWIKFRSDGTGTGKGFVGEYTFIHGNNIVGTQGEIASPLYPHPFKHAVDVSWRVTVDFGFSVRLVFDDFHVDSFGGCYNSKIYDGYDESAPVLKELCGINVPSPIQSSSNVIFIKLSGDSYRIGNWFHLNWYQVPRESETGNTDEILAECNEVITLGDFTNGTHYFTSPGYPTGYANNLRCKWLITSPSGTHLVIKLLNIDVEESPECVSDYVAVYSGYAVSTPPSPEARLLGKYCLSNHTRIPIEATNVMTVEFHSDVYVNRTGFKAVVYTECGGTLSGPAGVIEFNDTIRLNQIRSWGYICEWRVSVRPGRKIEVNIEKMIIDKTDTGCGNYYLMLKNGDGPESPLLGNGTYCGRIAPAPLTTTSNHLYVKAVGSGLHVVYKLTYKEIGLDCGGIIELTSATSRETFSTPNYPNIPPPYSECFWTIVAKPGERVSIHFIDRFDLTTSVDCEKEYVEVRDGGTDSAKLLGKFCSDTNLMSMTSSGNYLYVHFYTNIPDPKNGFKAIVNSGDQCGGIIRAKKGVITSPNYPEMYNKKEYCQWWIIGPPDHTLKLEFRDLHLPALRKCETSDYVSIGEKRPNNDTDIKHIGTYCGVTKPGVLETAFNEVLIIFKSDSSSYINYRGFSLNFTASKDACGGSLSGMSGEFKSLGYPNPNFRAKYCEWHIIVPEGNQVRVDIDDLDISGSGDEIAFYLAFANDLTSQSHLRTIIKNTQDRTISSSTNFMTVLYWGGSGHQGIKARFTAVAPAPCGGIRDDLEGSLLAPPPPYNKSSYYCQWSLKAPDTFFTEDSVDTKLTLTVTISGMIGRFNRKNRACNYLMKYIMVGDLKNPVGVVCGNITKPFMIRSPAPLNVVSVLNGTYGPVINFDMKYKWQKCGGILNGPSHTITTPNDIEYPKSCAWRVEYPDNGEVISMTFNRLNFGNCEKGYIIVRNGGSMSPEIGKFCGNIKPHNITSSTHKLWIEYWASEAPGDFEFRLDSVSGSCGGTMQGSSGEIVSPSFPSQYPNNAECIWEITAETGYHIGLSFIKRFNLETSPSCTNDFIEVFDWDNKIEGSWKSLGKACGRNIPKAFDTVSNRMKVLFRSNAAIQGDGFSALWKPNCGGIFVATQYKQTIQSPQYPNFYAKNLNCNYTIVAPKGKSILVEFTEFQLESDHMNCVYDNLSIEITQYGWKSPPSIYCGNNKPPLQMSESDMILIFKTDGYVQRRGFQFHYIINECGGEIYNEEILRPPTMRESSEYFGRLNCTWIIHAPTDKSITLRFGLFELEFSRGCYYDRVDAFEGSRINTTRIIASLCGNLNETLPVLKSVGNTMTVSFISDDHNHFKGFSAEILFTKSIASGCGGNINLTNLQIWKTNKGSKYDSFEDCFWAISAKSGKNIVLTITSMDVKNSPNKTIAPNTAPCNGDYLEVRDGIGPFAELIGRYCGNSIPQPIISSLNTLWVRFYSDGEIEGAGVTANLDVIDSLCGETILHITNATRTITSPRYPEDYPLGIQCKWIVTAPYGFDIHVHLKEVNMEDSIDCLGDRLIITDKSVNKYISQDFGEDFIYSGVHGRHSDNGMSYHNPTGAYTFCSKWDSYDYYSGSTEIEIFLKTTSKNPTKFRKFKFDVGLANCNRNYTSPQGRIIHQGFTNCWMTITVPVGHTISLYFNGMRLYDMNDCVKNYLLIHDGDFTGPILTKLCGIDTPSPVFSTGNKLSLHSESENGVSWESYDITYTSSDQGQGCGGKIFNYDGKFTSPFYPNNYRNTSTCVWDVSVPRGYKITLEFSFFDIGSGDCSADALQISDTNTATESRVMIYCPNDNPSKFHGISNEVKVTYTTSVNNGGNGWMLNFVSEKQSVEADVDEGPGRRRFIDNMSMGFHIG